MSQPTYHILLIDYSHSFSPQITRRKHVCKNYHLTSGRKNPQRQELTLRTHIKYYIYVYIFIYEPS